jgi:hypothetical protein
LNLDLTLECTAPRPRGERHGPRGDGAPPVLVERKLDRFSTTLCACPSLLDAKFSLKLLQLDLNANPPGAPIVKIHLSVEPVRPRAAQGGLFLLHPRSRKSSNSPLARIAGIVGQNKVGSLQLLDTHRPEAFRMHRFTPGQMPEQAACGAQSISQ